MWRRITILTGLAALAIPASAAADGADASSDHPASKVRLMGNMGVASAIGEMGGTLTYAPLPEVQIELGAGIGFSGFQLSVMPKLSVGERHHRLTLGVGPSVGLSSNNNPKETCISYWLNAEAGYEFRSSGGFSFLLALGVGRGLAGKVPGYGAPGVAETGDAYPPEPATDFRLFPEGRIAFGRWF